jgi:hypothetical protein
MDKVIVKEVKKGRLKKKGRQAIEKINKFGDCNRLNSLKSY